MPPDGYEPFLATILDAPHEDAPRLVYADWLEERGDPRSEFIRIQCRLASLDPAHADVDRLLDRENQLLLAHGDDWRNEIPEWARNGCSFARGFIEHVVLWTQWKSHFGEHLSKSAPVMRITLQEAERSIREMTADGPGVRHLEGLTILDPRLTLESMKHLTESAATLAPLRTLEFMGVRFGDTGALMISLSPHLLWLGTLKLIRCGIGHRGIDRLVHSEHLLNLSELDLADNDLSDDCIWLLGQSPLMQTVTHLTLDNNSFHLGGVRALTESPHFERLTHLSLNDCSVGDAAAALILERFPRLKSLGLERTPLTGMMMLKLQAHYGPRVHLAPN